MPAVIPPPEQKKSIALSLFFITVVNQVRTSDIIPLTEIGLPYTGRLWSSKNTLLIVHVLVWSAQCPQPNQAIQGEPIET